MKILITWQMHEGKLHETLARFSQMTPEQEQALMGPNVKLLGRWHDLVRGSGAAAYECKAAEDLAAYALHWNQFMDLDIAVVSEDDEAREIGRRWSAAGD